MIVCNCNNINTQKTTEAIIEGKCKTPKEIHAYCNSRPSCCMCFKPMRDTIANLITAK